VTGARYDGHADWYDSTFGYLSDASAGLLARLLGPAAPGEPICLDLGCGTGLHFDAVPGAGYTVVGVDLSADQLRLAKRAIRLSSRLTRGGCRCATPHSPPLS
jgi:SAM-dependent methyltransferase